MIITRLITNILAILFLFLSSFLGNKEKVNKSSLKNAFNGKFYVGVALNAMQINQDDSLGIKVLKQHFNSIVAENCMKSSIIQPEEGVFDFGEADKFVELGKANKMFIVGHTLIWHSQTPLWFFVGKDGKEVSREILIERMRNHIYQVVRRYKGRVNGWDVVNEAIEDDGSYRKSKFYEIIGEQYIELAFKFAREADSKVELYYNDFNMASPAKRDAVVNMVIKMQSRNIKISGIGMQGHLGLEYPSVDSFEKSILAYSKLGIPVMITELDLTVLPNPSKPSSDVSLNYTYKEEMDPFKNGLSKEMEEKFEKRYLDMFNLFLKHHDKISRVTLWGVSDKNSWKNNWPIIGRTDYSLLFDRNYVAKPVLNKIIKLVKE